MMNLDWPDFANIKTHQLFEFWLKFGDSVAKRKLNSFFPVFLWYNPGESGVGRRGSLYDPGSGPNGSFGRWVN